MHNQVWLYLALMLMHFGCLLSKNIIHLIGQQINCHLICQIVFRWFYTFFFLLPPLIAFEKCIKLGIEMDFSLRLVS